MKSLKIVLATLTLFFTLSCVKTTTTAVANHIEFKIGKEGIEKNLAKEFDFQNFSVGTYITTKNKNKEKGINVKFKKDNLNKVSDSLLNVYSNVIQKEVKANLLHLSDYDYINITFEQELEDGDIKKINSVKIKKQLK